MEPKSYIIPDDIFEEVNAVTHELIRYENPNNLNWMPAYQDVLMPIRVHRPLKSRSLSRIIL